MRAPRSTQFLLTAAVCALMASATAGDVHAAQANRLPGVDSRQSANREAYDRGYREGLRTGENHGRNGRDFNFDREGAYRAGDLGYNRRFGSRDTYRVEFRLGFAAGYRESYDRYRVVRREDRRDNRAQRRVPPRGYQEPAMARGYSDGYEQGIEDSRDRDRYDPVRHSDYREGDDGYYRDYGSKDVYRNNYRTGFRQGYEDGYRGGVRR